MNRQNDAAKLAQRIPAVQGHRVERPPSRPERRERRSPDPIVALTRLLESARRTTGAEAVALADASGLLIAGAGSHLSCEELAALAAASPANDTVPTRLEVLQAGARLLRLRVNGVEVLVCATGAAAELDGSLEHVAAGVTRILGAGRAP